MGTILVTRLDGLGIYLGICLLVGGVYHARLLVLVARDRLGTVVNMMRAGNNRKRSLLDYFQMLALIHCHK